MIDIHTIEIRRSLRYLEVELDGHLLLTRHIEIIFKRAVITTLAISRIMYKTKILSNILFFSVYIGHKIGNDATIPWRLYSRLGRYNGHAVRISRLDHVDHPHPGKIHRG